MHDRDPHHYCNYSSLCFSELFGCDSGSVRDYTGKFFEVMTLTYNKVDLRMYVYYVKPKTFTSLFNSTYDIDALGT